MSGGRGPLGPWRFLSAFGVVSLLADVVYEGARAVTGPYLGLLGASALTVGLVTGLGEAVAFAGRLGTGVLADRSGAYWPLTLAGYTLTVVAVPLLGLTTALGLAATLVVAERAGKAVRAPARDVLLSHAAGAVGRGRGFALHEALDQAGAITGPLLVAAVLAATGGNYRPAFLVLAVPGAAALGVLLWLRARVPDPAGYEPATGGRAATEAEPEGTRDAARLPRAFWSYLTFTVVATAGFAPFGILGFHLVNREVVPAAAVPLVYAAAMAVDAVAALATGWWYDRLGRRVLLAVPPLAAAVPALALRTEAVPAIAGVLLWGAVLGIQESTMRAAVADLVPAARRGTAYGIFAAGFGLATLAAGLLAGALYDRSTTVLVGVVVAVQAVALAALATALRPVRRTGASASA